MRKFARNHSTDRASKTRSATASITPPSRAVIFHINVHNHEASRAGMKRVFLISGCLQYLWESITLSQHGATTRSVSMASISSTHPYSTNRLRQCDTTYRKLCERTSLQTRLSSSKFVLVTCSTSGINMISGHHWSIYGCDWATRAYRKRDLYATIWICNNFMSA